MRFAFVPFVILAASFTLAAAATPTPVYVVNLPAVQTVRGTVNVGNLPLDADGAVRVSSAPAMQMVWYELIGGPIEPDPSDSHSGFLPAINTDGYTTIAVLVRAPYGFGFNGQWRWAPDEPFTNAQDFRGGIGASFGGLSNDRYVFQNVGGDFRVRISWATSSDEITSVRVYLFP